MTDGPGWKHAQILNSPNDLMNGERQTSVVKVI